VFRVSTEECVRWRCSSDGHLYSEWSEGIRLNYAYGADAQLNRTTSDNTTPKGHTCISANGTNSCSTSYYSDVSGASYTSYLRTRIYKVSDNLGSPIGLNMDIQESYSPAANVSTGSGIGATVTDCFYMCSQACRLGGSASLSSTQTIVLNGQQVATKSVNWTCSGVTVTP
jgi:hypothetical protein